MHQAGVGVLDFVNVVKVLLRDGDLVGDITSDGCELVSQFARWATWWLGSEKPESIGL